MFPTPFGPIFNPKFLVRNPCSSWTTPSFLLSLAGWIRSQNKRCIYCTYSVWCCYFLCVYIRTACYACIAMNWYIYCRSEFIPPSFGPTYPIQLKQKGKKITAKMLLFNILEVFDLSQTFVKGLLNIKEPVL